MMVIQPETVSAHPPQLQREEVAPGEREAVEAIVRERMGSAAELAVPLDVQVGIGADWDDAAH